MSNNLTVAPRREFQSFHDLPIVLDLDTIDADIAILGIPYGAPYSMDDVTNDQTNAPIIIALRSSWFGCLRIDSAKY